MIISEFTEGKDYEIVGEHCVIGWAVKKLHGIRIPYVRQFNKKTDFDSFVGKATSSHKDSSDKRDSEEVDRISTLTYEQLELDTGNGKRKLDTHASVEVKHSPNKLNYWHFTVDYYPIEDSDKAISNTKGWRNMIAIHVRDILKRNMIPIGPSHSCFKTDYASLL